MRSRGGGLRRAVGSLWVRAGVTVALLALVASRLDWSLIGQRLSDGRPLEFAVAVALVLLALVAGAWRWRALLIHAGMPLRTRRLARIYAVSTFSSTFLPTTMGGDVARTLLVTRRRALLPRVATTVVVDRLGGFAGLMAIAWICFLVQPGHVPDDSRALLEWASAALALGGMLVLAFVLWAPAAARRAVPTRLVRTAVDARDLLRDYARRPTLLSQWLLLSIVYQALIALQLVVLGSAIDVDLPFTTAAVALALVTIVTLMPLSIGGFGLREGSYVVLLGGVSIAASDATLISVLSVAALLIASLPGAYLLLRGRIGAEEEPA